MEFQHKDRQLSARSSNKLSEQLYKDHFVR